MPPLKPELFINRELSWIEFNRRVLRQAKDERVPLLERVKFLAITGSNFDEFFMVRVGGLRMLEDNRSSRQDPAGLSPAEQLAAIGTSAHALAGEQHDVWHNELEPALARAGMRLVRPAQFSEEQRLHARTTFEQDILPLLSPIAIRSDDDFSLLMTHMLHLVVRLAPVSGTESRFAVVPVNRDISRFIGLPSGEGYEFVPVEDLIRSFIGRLFLNQTVEECVTFRFVRNADMSVREDVAADFLSEMQSTLEARKHSQCVHLAIQDSASDQCRNFLMNGFGIPPRDVYIVPEPLDIASLSFLSRMPGFKELKDDPWPPQPLPLKTGTTMFEAIAAGDILLYHPYDSYDTVLNFVREAAEDPNVLAIKQILYRTNRNSAIIAALVRAAERGKHVTALVELKARFDEARNIEWASELEAAGVQVIYGVKQLKTHAKLCLVVRREPDGIRRYMHFGTGNYNELTAQIYSDASFMTCNEDLGQDASAFFNAVTGYSQPNAFNRISASPLNLREKLMELIEGETRRSRKGGKASIDAKVNSLSDPDIIRALYAASQAGVKIRLNVRGICCLRPGIKGVSENISVVSIVDRFLEHARIMCFHHGGEQKVFISSADWMTRNLDNRVELLVPVDDPVCSVHLIEILDTCFRDSASAWRLSSDGTYSRVEHDGRKKPVRAQQALYRRSCEQARQGRRAQRTLFIPHRPHGADRE